MNIDDAGVLSVVVDLSVLAMFIAASVLEYLRTLSKTIDRLCSSKLEMFLYLFRDFPTSLGVLVLGCVVFSLVLDNSFTFGMFATYMLILGAVAGSRTYDFKKQVQG